MVLSTRVWSMSKIIIRLFLFIVDDFGGERLMNKFITFVFLIHKKNIITAS